MPKPPPRPAAAPSPARRAALPDDRTEASARRPRDPGDKVVHPRPSPDPAREDAARLRAVLESATDHAILTLGPDGRVASWNAGATNLLGWGEAEALGM